MRYYANPVTVEAVRIAAVLQSDATTQGLWLKLEDDRVFHATAEQIARFTPEPGDFVVTQADGYVYLNPKAVFERKYSPIKEANLPLRPRQILELLAEGKANKEIAWELNLSEGTVKVYLSHLFRRIGVTTRLEAALWARAAGLFRAR